MANYKNGEVPASALAPLDGQPEASLRADAAASWNRARKEIKAATGRDIRARGWNRSLAEQEKFFHLAYKPQASGGKDPRWYKGVRYVRRPGKAAAAIPGTSNHGWGIAVDVEDFGLENQWNSAWRAKAFPILAKHGWTDHSGRSIGEPWHIEYDPSKDKGTTLPTIPEDDMYNDSDRARDEEALRLLRLIVLAPSGHASPATEAESVYVQTISGVSENAAESRRQAGVLLGALAPAGAEKTIPEQLGE